MVLQLRIHRRNQDRTFDPDPWISASGPALASALPSVPAPFLLSPGVLPPEPGLCPWRSPKKESPKKSQHWREPKAKGNLTYHLYMPSAPRQGPRTATKAGGSALGPLGPPLLEEPDSQQPHPLMKPTSLTPSAPGVSSPPPSHKLELQTLKLEELTKKASAASAKLQLPQATDPLVAPAPVLAPAPAPTLSSVGLTLEEELQEAIRRAQLLPNQDINDILEDQMEPDGRIPASGFRGQGTQFVDCGVPGRIFGGAGPHAKLTLLLQTHYHPSPWTSLAPSMCCPPPRTRKSPLSSLHSHPPPAHHPPLREVPWIPWTGWRL
uniref:MEF2-activating motif and SAP domain-containing transcriptional regulator isoform X1 n=1 Tax=Jaculus jaculus TaxID=51337 RepID=UPI001E1B01EA|nr:MEF2-activating motif and SAP domain-containing transcriptional regulator isoform X1 [Jaculus jaculus]